jgi:hypothetical protein
MGYRKSRIAIAVSPSLHLHPFDAFLCPGASLAAIPYELFTLFGMFVFG